MVFVDVWVSVFSYYLRILQIRKLKKGKTIISTKVINVLNCGNLHSRGNVSGEGTLHVVILVMVQG